VMRERKREGAGARERRGVRGEEGGGGRRRREDTCN